MKYVKIMFLWAFLFNQLMAQGPKEFEIEEINWNKWDKFDGDSTRKIAFYHTLFTETHLKIQFANQIKILDVDGVSPLDLIYFRSDSSGFDVFINKENRLEPVLHVSSDLVEITRNSPLNPVKITTVRFDSVTFEYIMETYSSFIRDRSLIYELERTAILQKGIMDIYGNMPPSKFKVIMETPLVVGPGLKQLIRRLSVGETGFAAASIETKPGEHWWKVYIQEPDYVWRMGWLRRANVSIIYSD